uniref:Uncharacterized protein n=1 Tax=viral metagenome TaxID=1070528 RepID=A0A6H1ZW81_9ZZZZ
MQLDPVWFAIEQIRRVLESMGWKIVAQDTGGDRARVTIEKLKSEILPKGK